MRKGTKSCLQCMLVAPHLTTASSAGPPADARSFVASSFDKAGILHVTNSISRSQAKDPLLRSDCRQWLLRAMRGSR